MNLYGQLFFTFTKIGTFTIGGGYAMLPLIEKDLVERKRWIEPEEFVDMVAVSQSLPGILAVNILLIALFFRQFDENVYVEKIFKAIRPAVVALIAVPVFTTARHIGIHLKTIVIPVAAAVLIWYWGVSPVYVVLGAAVIGVVARLLLKFFF